MCCFTKPIDFVGSTRIFARFLDSRVQCVVYEMRINAKEELAMVLPLPVARPLVEDSLSFVDLSGYPEFFDHIKRAFPKPLVAQRNLGGGDLGPFAGAETLRVERVGAFDASFVPTIADFARLDPQFRLDDKVWKALPEYRDFGFAVFKLRAGEQQVHPMAFKFRSATPARLFFPTLHIHDGEVHEEEKFDHTLYAQAWTNAVIKGPDWEESGKIAALFVDMRRAKDLVWRTGHFYRRNINGLAKNEDITAEARRLG